MRSLAHAYLSGHYILMRTKILNIVISPWDGGSWNSKTPSTINIYLKNIKMSIIMVNLGLGLSSLENHVQDRWHAALFSWSPLLPQISTCFGLMRFLPVKIKWPKKNSFFKDFDHEWPEHFIISKSNENFWIEDSNRTRLIQWNTTESSFKLG